MVITADDVLFATDIGVGEERQQGLSNVTLECDGSATRFWWCPLAKQLLSGDAAVEKAAIEFADESSVVFDPQHTVTGELAEHGHLYVPFGRDLPDPCDIGLGDCDDHALLRLAQPDLPRGQAGILQRYPVEMDDGAEFLRHLAYAGREASCPAVGDCVVQALVPGHQDHLECLLFVNWVADLHGASRNFACGVVGLH